LHSISIDKNQNKPLLDIELPNRNIHTSHDKQSKHEIGKQEKPRSRNNNSNHTSQFHNNPNNPRSTQNFSQERVKEKKKNLHVWRHEKIVVASFKSLLQRGHVMHASNISLLTFTICPDISVLCVYANTFRAGKDIINNNTNN